jgi:putative acetyltransferase
MITIRTGTDSDLPAVSQIIQSAFPGRHGDEIAELTRDLLKDPTAQPHLSLVAELDDKPAGHILFTAVEIIGKPRPAAILAPLSVVPEFQSQGIGGTLIREGLRLLAESGTGLVFVLGHPGYYPRHGFMPAGKYGFEAPYPIPDDVAEAWMFKELSAGEREAGGGRIQCADALDDPKYWRE